MKLSELIVIEAGLLPYAEALTLQLELVEHVKTNAGGPAYLVLVEHPRVITVGRSGSGGNILLPAEALKARGFEVFESSRGGDVTYHGPGQIVGYPIVPLRRWAKDIHKYLRALEEVLLRAVARWGIEGQRWEGRTGVWTDGGKLASIGVALTRWVTYHGWALNVNTRLDDFGVINPCGFTDVRMTSMQQLCGEPLDMARVRRALAEEFCAVFDCIWRNKPSTALGD